MTVILHIALLGIDCDRQTCGIPSPQCGDSNLIIETTECNALGDYLPGFHFVRYKCKEDENRCYQMVGTGEVYHSPFYEDKIWSECPVCQSA